MNFEVLNPEVIDAILHEISAKDAEIRMRLKGTLRFEAMSARVAPHSPTPDGQD